MGIMENTKQVSVKNCIKYIVFAGIIYAVLKVVPTTQLSNIEISVLICVILLGIFPLDCLTSSKKKKENMANTNLFDLDLDVDLDFNKTQNIREPATDIKRNLPDKSSESSESTEKGINMSEVKKELAKRNVILSDESPKRLAIKKKKSSNKVEDDDADEKSNKSDEKSNKSDEKSNKSNKKSYEKSNNSNKKSNNSNKKSSGINCEVEVSKMRRDVENRIRQLKQELRNK